jgi:hypothetical protein
MASCSVAGERSVNGARSPLQEQNTAWKSLFASINTHQAYRAVHNQNESMWTSKWTVSQTTQGSQGPSRHLLQMASFSSPADGFVPFHHRRLPAQCGAEPLAVCARGAHSSIRTATVPHRVPRVGLHWVPAPPTTAPQTVALPSPHPISRPTFSLRPSSQSARCAPSHALWRMTPCGSPPPRSRPWRAAPDAITTSTSSSTSHTP